MAAPPALGSGALRRSPVRARRPPGTAGEGDGGGPRWSARQSSAWGCWSGAARPPQGPGRSDTPLCAQDVWSAGGVVVADGACWTARAVGRFPTREPTIHPTCGGVRRAVAAERAPVRAAPLYPSRDGGRAETHGHKNEGPLRHAAVPSQLCPPTPNDPAHLLRRVEGAKVGSAARKIFALAPSARRNPSVPHGRGGHPALRLKAMAGVSG